MLSNNNQNNQNAIDGQPSTNWDRSVTKFEDLELNPELLRGVFGQGFMKPSVIQQKAILPLIEGRDTIAQAQSGSGKTATFCIGLLQNIVPEQAKLQGIVLANTRELASQIRDEMELLSQYMGIRVLLCTGGMDIRAARDKAREGVHVVVGTPGRVMDMIKREFIQTDYVRCLVIDEADEMLGTGFLEQVNAILKEVPSDTQLGIFSATMPPEVVKLIQEIMNDPAIILVKNCDLTLKGKDLYAFFEFFNGISNLLFFWIF